MAVAKKSFIRTRAIWTLESWGLKRIDAWGVSYIAGGLVLVAHHSLTVQTFLLLLVITVNYWLGYWLNDYFDAPYDLGDEHKARQNLFIQNPAVRRVVWGIVGAVLGLSALIFLTFGWRGVFVLVLSYLIMWAYSAPPLRLKNKPGLDLLTHAFFVQSWPYVICMWLTGSTWTYMDFALVGVCFLASLNGQLNQQIRDFEVDTRTDSNFATRVGLQKTMIILKVSNLAMVLLFTFGVISRWIPWPFIPFGLLGLPKVFYGMLHHLDNANRTFPRIFIYIIMLLALLYMQGLIVLDGII
jgi:chlorophyll synthase